MKNIYSIIILLTLVLGMALNVYGGDDEESTYETEVSGVGTSAATFLEIGAGARASGLGGAYVAIANDASALYWNPAGIVWGTNKQVEIMHSNWLAGTSYDYLGAVIPLGFFNSSLGFSFVSLYMDEQPVRTVDYPEGTGETYDARDYAVGITYAAALTDRFSFGLTAKYINQRIWHESGSAFAMDMGIFYNTQIDGLRLGFCMSNFGTEIQLDGRDLYVTVDPDDDTEGVENVSSYYSTDSYSLPLLFRAGISYEKQWGDMGSTLFAVGVNHPSNADESINLGFEYSFMNIFFLRTGYENLFDEDSENGISLGAGLDYYNNNTGFGVRFDYSWSDWGLLDNSDRFSVCLVF